MTEDALEFDGFEWDEGNRAKCLKHGVARWEIEALFEEGAPIVLPDDRHSRDERRLLAIGRTGGGRHLYVVFTLRRAGGDVRVRPISARYMHAKEVEGYAKARARLRE